MLGGRDFAWAGVESRHRKYLSVGLNLIEFGVGFLAL